MLNSSPSDQTAITIAREVEMNEKKAGRPYRQDVIDNLDAWLGEVSLYQQNNPESAR